MKKKVVMLIDDNPYSIEQAQHYLEKDGYKVIGVGDAEYALDLAERIRPNLIACDIRMPKMDGIEFALAAKKREALKGIPLVAVTSATLDRDRLRALHAGFIDYIEKPIDIRIFVKILEQYIK